MLGGILFWIFAAGVAHAMIAALARKYPFADAALLRKLFWYHLLLSLVYLAYISSNPSDSRAYYEKVIMGFRGDHWMGFYGTSTRFIEWVAYPFIKYIGFSFGAVMALFSFMGFIGFLYFYIFFKENLRFKHQFMGYDLLTLTFFLPNLHFWSSSLGKGSIIFMGIGLFFYGISNMRARLIPLIIGGLVVYHVRPHVMLVMLVSCTAGFLFSSKGVSMAVRLTFLACASVAFAMIFKDVLNMVGIDQDEFLTQGVNLSHRAKDLSKATSGVDISQYSFPMKVFTFLYRPLFVDAPGALGLIVSFENLFYLVITYKVIGNMRGIKFLISGNFLVKSAVFSFLTIAAALAQISGNLGLAMRQKSQVMILLMFVALCFLDEQRLKVWKAQQLRKQRMARMQQAELAAESTVTE